MDENNNPQSVDPDENLDIQDHMPAGVEVPEDEVSDVPTDPDYKVPDEAEQEQHDSLVPPVHPASEESVDPETPDPQPTQLEQ